MRHFFLAYDFPLRYLLATLSANEVKIKMTLVKRSFNKTTFGPSLCGEVVTTINRPIMAKAMDAQTNTFVAIFCIVLVSIFLFAPYHTHNTNNNR